MAAEGGCEFLEALSVGWSLWGCGDQRASSVPLCFPELTTLSLPTPYPLRSLHKLPQATVSHHRTLGAEDQRTVLLRSSVKLA